MRVHRALEKYSGLFVLSWLALISYLQARGVTRLVEGALGDTRSRPKPARQRMRTTRRATADAILERNPFDSATPRLVRPPAAPTAPPAKRLLVDDDPLSAPQCGSAQVVILTEAPELAWSVAAMRSDPSARAHDYRVGDHVAGRLVEYIGYNPVQHTPSVWLSDATGLCQTSLFSASSSSAPGAPSAPRAPRASRAPIDDARPAALLAHVRVIPVMSDGVVIGVRLVGIRPHSLLQLIGLENGDRLESINGFALGTPSQAFRAYAELRAAHRVALNIERRGRPVTMAYRID